MIQNILGDKKLMELGIVKNLKQIQSMKEKTILIVSIKCWIHLTKKEKMKSLKSTQTITTKGEAHHTHTQYPIYNERCSPLVCYDNFFLFSSRKGKNFLNNTAMSIFPQNHYGGWYLKCTVMDGRFFYVSLVFIGTCLLVVRLL